MAFNLVQAGSSLYSINAAGGVSSALTLPTGITLAKTRRPRFTRFGQYVIVANTPSRPLSVDDKGVVRPLTPLPPTSAPVLAGETGGVLSGRYLVKQTFVTLDSRGNTISESDYGPLPSAATSIAAQYLRVTNLSLSTDTSTISGTRLYRTTAGPGSAYFQWATIPGNTQTRFRDDLSDAALRLIAAPSLGSAPDLTLVVAWQGRLWGVDRLDNDFLRYTEAGTAYAWNPLNTLPIPPIGDDRYGITALVARRNVLSLGRDNRLVQVAGSTRANIRVVGVVENAGVTAPDSVIVYQDIMFFLWRDGVYQWDAEGLTALSTRAGVSSWFQTDNYFNRSLFPQAFAVFDPIKLAYRLFLCSAGQATPDQWVEYSLLTKKFYGPHRTLAFTPTCAMTLRGLGAQPYPMIGSREGYVSRDTETRADWGGVAIPMRVTMVGHSSSDEDTDREAYFGHVHVQTAPEARGTLTVIPFVGDMNQEVQGGSMIHDLTQTQAQLDRVGAGVHVRLTFENDRLGENVTLYGYSIDPVFMTGQR